MSQSDPQRFVSSEFGAVVRQRAIFQYFAIAQSQHMGRILVQLRQDMRRHQQRHALRLQLSKQPRQAGARFRVEAGCRFIQQQDFRTVNDGLADGDTLAQTARQLVAGLLQAFCQSQLLRGSLDRLRDSRCRQALGGGRIFKTLRHGQRLIQAIEIGQVTHDPMYFTRLFQHIHASHVDRTGKRGFQTRNAAHQRGFAGAVGADQCSHATSFDLQADLMQGTVTGIIEGKAGDFYHVIESIHYSVINQSIR